MFIITLNDFYQYVFGDWAKPSALPSKIQLKPEQQQTKSKRDAEAIEAKKKKFSFIIGNPRLSEAFRWMLRNLKNTDLEALLYGDHTYLLTYNASYNHYKIPHDDLIKEAFIKLDQKYGYFKDIHAVDVFIKLFKASKLIADYVEENNVADDSVAYTHAYKMMVLFKVNPERSFEAIDNFILAHAAKTSSKFVIK